MAIRLVPSQQSRPAPNATRLELAKPDSAQTPKVGFGKILQAAIDEVVASQNQADSLINEFVTGGDVDIHEAIIAAEQANLTLSLAVQVRNRAVEAFQEIMRIQV